MTTTQSDRHMILRYFPLDQSPTTVPVLGDTWSDWLAAWPDAHVAPTDTGQLRVQINRRVMPTFISRHDLGYQIVDGRDLWPVVVDSLALAGMLARARQRMRQHPRHGSVRGEPCWLAPITGKATCPLVNVANPIITAMGLKPGPRGGRVDAGRVAFYVFNGHRPGPGPIQAGCERRNCTNPAHLTDTP